MTLVRVNDELEVRLPADVRDERHLSAGDMLDVTVIDGGALLRPAMDRDRAIAEVRRILDSSPGQPGDAGRSADAIMNEVVDDMAEPRVGRRHRSA
jgi:AbrB family looped-hinge helix DNA binding protein